MRFRILPVKNVTRLNDAGDALINRPIGMPGMGTITGVTGAGKTSAVTWYINQVNGVYVRAMRLWTAKSMLAAIALELDIETRRMNNSEMVKAIVRRLAESARPLFIDEADYIVESGQLIDTLRDIHDMSTAAIILIGMHGIEAKIRGNEQFTGRIAQWVRFLGADMEDARLLANGLCEVKVSEDLLAALHKKASPQRRGKDTDGAEVRRLVVGLSKIEEFAIGIGLAEIGLKDWPAGWDFFVGRPVSSSSAKVTRLRPVLDKEDK